MERELVGAGGGGPLTSVRGCCWHSVRLAYARGCHDGFGGSSSGFGGGGVVDEGVGEGACGGVGVGGGHVLGPQGGEGPDALDGGADVFAGEEVAGLRDGELVALDQLDECGAGVVEVIVEESLLVLGEGGEWGGVGVASGGFCGHTTRIRRRRGWARGKLCSDGMLRTLTQTTLHFLSLRFSRRNFKP